MTYPILYTFRRCPYAIRARLGLVCANQNVYVREVLLKDKPQSMLSLSPKGTVPVLYLPNGEIIDESREVIEWALNIDDPLGLLVRDERKIEIENLISSNDDEFKFWLDRYKYFERYPEESQQHYRGKAEVFIRALENLLAKNKYLFGPTMSYADISIMPFVRQFAHVDKARFFNTPYVNVQRWLVEWLESPLFLSVMKKYPLWDDSKKSSPPLLITKDESV